jgi:hypothetical protein
MDIDFSGISHHDLMFHKTPLACHEFGHYISVIVFLGNCLKERGFLIRGNVGQLNEFVDSSPTSICVFLGNGDYRIAINSFLRANKFLCSELTNCLGKNTTEARHTLMLVQTYISHLEETLVVMHKMAQ